MRSSRMRGYGSWCIGWREAERKPYQGGGGPGIFFYGFIILLVISCIKVAIETGNPTAFIIGLAVIAGVFKGLQ